MENSPTIISLKAGDQDAIEKIYLEARPKFIPWIMERYGISQYYAEEIFVETILAFRNLVDNNLLPDLHGEYNFLLESMGVKVAEKILERVGHKGLGPMSYTIERGPDADKNHNVHLVDIPFEYTPVDTFETPLQKLAEKARQKLNPECAQMLLAMSRTNLTPDQLAKVFGHGNAKGMKFMQDICMDRFSKLLDEEIANR